MDLDATGKVTLDHIYSQPDPRTYFSTLRKLEYRIPQLALPHFAALIHDYREATGVSRPQVVDVGSSYGINAALLRCRLSMTELYERYDGVDASAIDGAALLARDRELVRTRGINPPARFIGLDIAEPALDYARDAGFLDDTVCADLESNDLTPAQAAILSGTDLVVSTGCLGYVTDATLARVVLASGRRPWMAHFVLRMFPFEPIAQRLAQLGYRTTRAEGRFAQRRFASPDEQEQVLRTLSRVDVDPAGFEDDGWLYAQLYLSRPDGD